MSHQKIYTSTPKFIINIGELPHILYKKLNTVIILPACAIKTNHKMGLK